MTLTPEFVELFCLPGDDRNSVIAGSTGEDINKTSFDVYQYDNATGMPTGVRNTYKGDLVTFSKSISLATGTYEKMGSLFSVYRMQTSTVVQL